VAEGTYTPGPAGDRNVTFQLKSGVAIYGGFAGDEDALADRDWAAHPTLLSGDLSANDDLFEPTSYAENSLHVLSGDGVDAAALLDGFTITGGNADVDNFSSGWGGGMYLKNSQLTLRNIIFEGNTALGGGGMFIDGGGPRLNNVVFRYNTGSKNGGGLHTYNLSNPELTGVTFIGNQAVTWGGGLYNVQSNITLTEVVFAANGAESGAGLFSNGGQPELVNVEFVDNHADINGGGLHTYNSSNPTLTNVAMVGNSADTSGGGIYHLSGTLTLTNVSMVGNKALNSSGGGIYHNSGTLTLTNAIVWGNTPDGIAGPASPAVTNSDIEGCAYTGNGNICLDPLFVDAASGNLRLQPASPAIEAGDNAAPDLAGITTDLDGSSRFVDYDSSGTAQVDMGAYEAQLGGEIIYVDEAAPGPLHDGASWETAFPGLQAGLAAAQAGAAIWVAQGSYTPGAAGSRLATFRLKNGVQIYGGFAGAETVLSGRDWAAHPTILSGDLDRNGLLDGGNAYHVVAPSGVDASAILDGFTITGGNANVGTSSLGWGGGMYNFESNPSLTNVTFSGNTAKDGGGMFNYTSSPSLTDVTFSDNTASYGGGMYNNISSSPSLKNVAFSGNTASYGGGGMFNYTSSPSLTDVTFSGNTTTSGPGGGMYNRTNSNPTLTHVTFSGNTAYRGGGMYNTDNSSPSLTNVTFSDNTASYGGGMSNYTSSPSLTDVTFSDNTASYGGGMYNTYNSNLSLTNVAFSGNTASYGGGGMYNNNSSPSLTNVTFSGNTTTSGFGGGIYHRDGLLTLTNGIVWGNTPDGIYGTAPTAVSYSDIQGCAYTGNGNICQDPLFVDAATGNLRLGDSSPAIEAGDNDAPGLVGITTDLDGSPRIVDGDLDGLAVVDMGVYEFNLPYIHIYLPLIAK
jgi:hypothetical protein